MSPSPTGSLRPAPRIADLFDRPVLAAELDGPAQNFRLHPLEEACIEHAKEKRRTEFSTGRACARFTLSRYGYWDYPILVGEKREPLWPGGMVGSITHADGYCGAVVANKATYRGVGVDVERRNRLKPETERLICTPSERDWLDSLPETSRALHATILFSAKEAFYKCQFAITRAWLGFRDVELRLDGLRFEIRLVDPSQQPKLPPGGIKGRVHLERDHVFTGIGIEPEGSGNPDVKTGR